MNKTATTLVIAALAGSIHLAYADPVSANAADAYTSSGSRNAAALSYRQLQALSGTGAVWEAQPTLSTRADDPVPAGGVPFSQLQAESSESSIFQPHEAPVTTLAADPANRDSNSYAALQAESSESPVWQSGAPFGSSPALQSSVAGAATPSSLGERIASFFHHRGATGESMN